MNKKIKYKVVTKFSYRNHFLFNQSYMAMNINTALIIFSEDRFRTSRQAHSFPISTIFLNISHPGLFDWQNRKCIESSLYLEVQLQYELCTFLHSQNNGMFWYVPWTMTSYSFTSLQLSKDSLMFGKLILFDVCFVHFQFQMTFYYRKCFQYEWCSKRNRYKLM